MFNDDVCPACDGPAVCEHGNIVNGRAAHIYTCDLCGERLGLLGYVCAKCERIQKMFRQIEERRMGMKSAEYSPTPQHVVDAIQVVAAWLREIEAAEALISPTGGASFHPERQADRLLAGWQEELDRFETLHDALERISDDPRAGYSVRGIARDALNAVKPVEEA